MDRVGIVADRAVVEGFWRSFVEATGIDGPYTAWSFGNDPDMAKELGLLVRDGPKRATTSLLSWYEGEDAEPLPRIGDLEMREAFDGVFIPDSFSKQAVYRWQDELVPQNEDLPAITFADTSAQKRWVQLTLAADYWLDVLPA